MNYFTTILSQLHLSLSLSSRKDPMPEPVPPAMEWQRTNPSRLSLLSASRSNMSNISSRTFTFSAWSVSILVHIGIKVYTTCMYMIVYQLATPTVCSTYMYYNSATNLLCLEVPALYVNECSDQWMYLTESTGPVVPSPSPIFRHVNILVVIELAVLWGENAVNDSWFQVQ